MSNGKQILFAVTLYSICCPALAESRGVDQLARDLKSEVVRDRYQAADELKKLGGGAKDALPELVEALQDPENSVRQLAAQAIGNLGQDGRPALPALLKVLQETRNFLAIDYAMAMTRISDTATRDAVRQLLLVKSPKTQQILLTIRYLDEFPDHSVRDSVELLTDESFEVRANAAEFLGDLATRQIKDRPVWELVTVSSNQVVEALAPALDDSHTNVRIQAGIAIAKLARENSQRAIPAIIEGVIAGQIQGYEAASLVRFLPEDAIPAFANALNVDHEAQTELIATMAVWPDLAAPVLIEAVKNDNAGIRYGAATGLGHHRLEQHRNSADSTLARTLSDNNVDVRLRAAESLVQVQAHQTKVAVPVLTTILNDDSIPRRVRAATALGLTGAAAKSAVKPLMALLEHSDETLRVHSAVSLTQIDPDLFRVSLPIFEETLQAESQAPHPLKRRTLNAAMAMGTKAHDLADCLSQVCQRPVALYDEIHLLEARVLATIAPEMAKPGVDNLVQMLAEGHWTSQSAAIRTLGEIGPPAVSAAPQLLQLVHSDNHKTATRAAVTLLRIRPSDGEARQYISDSLAFGTRRGRLTGEKRQRFYACMLALHPDDAVTASFVPELITVLANPDGRYTSRVQGLIGRQDKSVTDKAVPELRKLLDHKSEKVREAAAAVLERLKATSISG